MISFDKIVQKSMLVSNIKRELRRYQTSMLHMEKNGFVISVRKNVAQDKVIMSIEDMIKAESENLTALAEEFRLKPEYLKSVQECTDKLSYALEANSKDKIEALDSILKIIKSQKDLRYEVTYPSL